MATATALQRKRGDECAVPRVEPSRVGPIFSPNVDILETADELTLVADVPGASPESIDIQYERGDLTMRGRVAPRQPDETQYVLREYGVGDFQRVFQLGESIDHAKIDAEISEGVLTVHLPKMERIKPRKIAVKST